MKNKKIFKEKIFLELKPHINENSSELLISADDKKPFYDNKEKHLWDILRKSCFFFWFL